MVSIVQYLDVPNNISIHLTKVIGSFAKPKISCELRFYLFISSLVVKVKTQGKRNVTLSGIKTRFFHLLTRSINPFLISVHPSVMSCPLFSYISHPNSYIMSSRYWKCALSLVPLMYFFCCLDYDLANYSQFVCRRVCRLVWRQFWKLKTLLKHSRTFLNGLEWSRIF